MSIYRHSFVENNTGGILTDAPLQQGRDYKLLMIERTFDEFDIDDALYDDASVGCLVGTLKHGQIAHIINCQFKNLLGGFFMPDDVRLKVMGQSLDVYVAPNLIYDNPVVIGDTLYVMVLIGPEQ